MIKIPDYLQKGDLIGMVCPSGFMPRAKADAAIATLEKWGYRVKVGKTVGGQFHYFSGTDEDRLADLQEMLDDKEIKAVLFGRGGYGLSRIIDRIDFKTFRKYPKWLIGFSDITVLHAHCHAVAKVATIHSSMVGAFNDGGADNEFVQSIRKVIRGQLSHYSCAAHPLNQTGTAEGMLIGGNLSIIAHLVGSESSFKTKQKILFIEDVGEYTYHIDRMMIQLKRAGMLDGLAGLIVGGFTEMKDTDIPFGASVAEVIQSHVKEYNYPVCFDFPVSHDVPNYALKVGVKHRLVVGKSKTVLKELR